MQQHGIHRLYLFLSIVLLLIASLIALVIPIHAQDGLFATNTPEGESPVEESSPESIPTSQNSGPVLFATNTPAGGISSSASEVTISTAPQAPLFNYGMRFWVEADFVDMVLAQVARLEAGDEDAQLAVNILLYEMSERFPSSPTDPEQRRQLINAMINAPVGSLDMRTIMRPFIQNTIDANPGEFLMEADGFQIVLSAANLDGTGATDSVVNVRYEADGVVRYDEYLMAVANDTGSYTLLQEGYDLAAAPYGGINSVTIEFLQDVNADSLDELVLRVDDGLANDRLFILQHRSGRAVDLIDPERQLRVGEIINWSFDTANTALTIFEYEPISDYPDWQCFNQIEYTWQYERNLYRRSQDLNARFTPVDSMGCALSAADLFSMPSAEAITTIEAALLEYGFEDPSANRALMSLASFYVLTGRLDDARNTAQSIITVDDDSTWEAQQANALINASNAAGNTALDICEAVAMASEFPACDMSTVIGTFLNVVSLSTDMPVEEQLNNVGLPVLELVEVSEIGRANRTVISFQYFDSGWWGFYDNGDGFYAYEETQAPAGFGEASFPLPQAQTPQTAIDALLIDNDPGRALAILENTAAANPNVPLEPGALYMQALAYEFTGDRESARANYYEIWDTYLSSVWGAISAPHLELR